MEKSKENSRVQTNGPLLKIPFDKLALVTVSLPAVSLAVCFIYSMIFQYDNVNLTMCEVKNFLPSISAVTGPAPQRYLWRLCIGLHTTPRYMVGIMYYNYYMSRISVIEQSKQRAFKLLVTTTFWTYTVENTCLMLVSIIANYENYPVHEKIFVIFMFSSMFHQFFVVILFGWVNPTMTSQIRSSYTQKKLFFALSLMSTASLVYFFIQHRIFCAPNAFSWFSASEYGIAYFNIAFHYTAINEFKNYYQLMETVSQSGLSNGSAVSPASISNGKSKLS